MITRAQYMDGDATHAAYYGDLATSVGLSYAGCDWIESVRNALRDGDDHLNSIPLATWDTRGAWMLQSRVARAAFKARGDSVSLAGLVCVCKQAARDGCAS